MPLQFYESVPERVARLKRNGKFCDAGTDERPCVQTAVHRVVRIRRAPTDNGVEVPQGPEVTTQTCSKHRKFHINDPRYIQVSIEDLPWRHRKTDTLGYEGRVAREQRWVAQGGQVEHPDQVRSKPTAVLPVGRPKPAGRTTGQAQRPAGPPAARPVPPATFLPPSEETP